MAPPPSAPAKFPALLLAALPVLLLVPSFVLAAVASASKDWTWRSEYDTTTRALKGYTQRGPFITCETGETPEVPQVCARVTTPAGWCNASVYSFAENPHFCDQLGLGGRMLYAGDALLGAALLLALVLTASTLLQILRSADGTYHPSLFGQAYGSVSGNGHDDTEEQRSGWRRRRGHHRAHRRPAPAGVLVASISDPVAWLTLLARLCAAFAGLLLLLATLIITNTFVNIQYPVGNWFAEVSDPSVDPISLDFAGPYLMGQAVGWCAAAAVLAGAGAWMMGLVWDCPRVGVSGRAVEK